MPPRTSSSAQSLRSQFFGERREVHSEQTRRKRTLRVRAQPPGTCRPSAQDQRRPFSQHVFLGHMPEIACCLKVRVTPSKPSANQKEPATRGCEFGWAGTVRTSKRVLSWCHRYPHSFRFLVPGLLEVAMEAHDLEVHILATSILKNLGDSNWCP